MTPTTVYVHAWEYVNPGPDAGGGGFWWFPKEAGADKSFNSGWDGVNSAPGGKDDTADFRFDFETENTDRDAITAEIDADLNEHTAKATRRRIGKTVLLYWKENDFKMGTAIKAATT